MRESKLQRCIGVVLSRRDIAFGLVAFGLVGCSNSEPLRRAGTVSSSELPDDLRPVANPGYDAWVASFRSRASSQGFTRGVHFVGLQGQRVSARRGESRSQSGRAAANPRGLSVDRCLRRARQEGTYGIRPQQANAGGHRTHLRCRCVYCYRHLGP